jgi:hypothetical protein
MKVKDQEVQEIIDKIKKATRIALSNKITMHQDPDPYEQMIMGSSDDDDDESYYGKYWTEYLEKTTQHQDAEEAPAAPKKVISKAEKYPHTCPHCGSPAYIGGMNTVDCSNCNGSGGPKKKCSCGGNCNKDKCNCDKNKCGKKSGCGGGCGC